MRTRKSFEPRITRHPNKTSAQYIDLFLRTWVQRNNALQVFPTRPWRNQWCTECLKRHQFSFRNDRFTFRIQTIHHTLNQLQLILDRKVDEIRIHQNTVRRRQSGVVLEKHGRRDLLTKTIMIRSDRYETYTCRTGSFSAFSFFSLSFWATSLSRSSLFGLIIRLTDANRVFLALPIVFENHNWQWKW